MYTNCKSFLHLFCFSFDKSKYAFLLCITLIHRWLQLCKRERGQGGGSERSDSEAVNPSENLLAEVVYSE